MASAGVRGIATGKWDSGSDLLHHSGTPAPATREALLRLWDETTKEIDSHWPRIPPQRFLEVDTAFGAYEGVIFGLFQSGSTTRFTTAARDTSTCERSGSSHRPSTTEADEVP